MYTHICDVQYEVPLISWVAGSLDAAIHPPAVVDSRLLIPSIQLNGAHCISTKAGLSSHWCPRAALNWMTRGSRPPDALKLPDLAASSVNTCTCQLHGCGCQATNHGLAPTGVLPFCNASLCAFTWKWSHHGRNTAGGNRHLMPSVGGYDTILFDVGAPKLHARAACGGWGLQQAFLRPAGLYGHLSLVCSPLYRL